jgi:hypothetical protein
MLALAAITPLAMLVPSCTGFRQSSGGTDDTLDSGFGPSDAAVEGAADAGAHGDSGAAPGDAAADASLAPPSDVECTQAWNQATTTDPNCAARSVVLIEPGVFIADGIGVAVNSAGRVAFS